MNIILKLIITNKFTIQCKVIDSQNNEKLIQLNDKQQEEYIPCISFSENKITICEEIKSNSIHFVEEWFNHSEDYKLFTVQFQNKEYQLLPEVLFSLIINVFKQQIEREYIITNTLIQLPITNNNENYNKILQRIKISLQAINLNGILIENEDEIDYNYQQQGELLYELLQKKDEYEKYHNLLQKSIQLTQNKDQKQKLMQCIEKFSCEESFNKEISILSLKERTKLKLYTLDNYCIFIASRFFESLQDHINLTKVSKRMKNNLEKFHYNPISLHNKSIHLFPNIETLYIYNKDDKYLTGGRIQQYINWNKFSFYNYEENKKLNKEKIIEFKKVVWTKEDTEKEAEIQQTNLKNKDESFDIDNWIFIIKIPTIVNELDENCFENIYIDEIEIPETIKSIPKKCFEKVDELTSITLPLNKIDKIYGNKIYSIKNNQLEQSLFLPTSIKVINHKEVDKLTSFEISTTITSLDEKCFYGCDELKQIIIPETVNNIPNNTFMNLSKLEELTIRSNNYTWKGNRLFGIIDECLYHIKIPQSIKKVNNQEIKPLETFTIPTNVTKLSEYCFANCQELTEIKGLENIKEIGKGCFYRCNKMNQEEYPEVKKNIDQYFNQLLTRKEKKQLEKWTDLKCSDILFDSNIDDWDINTSVLNERIIGNKQLTFLIEDTDEEKFGYYLNTIVIYNKYKNEVTDLKTFHFNLQSKNNRLKQPMKFEIEDIEDGGYELSENNSCFLILIGDICLFKEKRKNDCYCLDENESFNFKKIEKALCGKVENFDSSLNETFILKRLIVIQMK